MRARPWWIATRGTACALAAWAMAAVACGSSGGPGNAHDGGSPGDDASAGGSSGGGSGGGGSSSGGSDDASAAADGTATAPDASAQADGPSSSVCPVVDDDAGTCNGLVPRGPFVVSSCVYPDPQVSGGSVVSHYLRQ